MKNGNGKTNGKSTTAFATLQKSTATILSEAEVLREVRKSFIADSLELGWTQQEISTKLGKKAGYVNWAMSGVVSPIKHA
jgi:hypothetical protein